MSGPWDDYAGQESGPWSDYGQEQKSAPTRTLGQEFGRNLGLTARAGANIVTGIPQMLADVPFRLARAAGADVGLPSQQFQDLLTRAGLPQPETQTERMAGAVTEGMGGYGVLRAATRGIPALSEALSANPGTQTVAGGMSGLGAQTVAEAGGGPVAQTVGATLGGALVPAGRAAVTNRGMSTETQARTAREGMDAGYKMPPSQTNPSIINKALEGYAGKLTTEQQAALTNERVAADLAKQHLGLPLDKDITVGQLDAIRAREGKAYAAVPKLLPDTTFDGQFVSDLKAAGDRYANVAREFPEKARTDILKTLSAVSPRKHLYLDTKATVDLVKQLRKDAKDQFNPMAEPAQKDLAGVSGRVADALDNLMDRNLEASGHPEALNALRDARRTIAKTYSVENALQEATGKIQSKDMAAQYGKGVPLTGELLTIGKMGEAFPRATQNVGRSPPGVSPLDYAVGGMASAASGMPGWMASVLGRPLVRDLILSGPYQRYMAQPRSPGTSPAQYLQSEPAVLMNALQQARREPQ